MASVVHIVLHYPSLQKRQLLNRENATTASSEYDRLFTKFKDGRGAINKSKYDFLLHLHRRAFASTCSDSHGTCSSFSCAS